MAAGRRVAAVDAARAAEHERRPRAAIRRGSAHRVCGRAGRAGAAAAVRRGRRCTRGGEPTPRAGDESGGRAHGGNAGRFWNTGARRESLARRAVRSRRMVEAVLCAPSSNVAQQGCMHACMCLWARVVCGRVCLAIVDRHRRRLWEPHSHHRPLSTRRPLHLFSCRGCHGTSSELFWSICTRLGHSGVQPRADGSAVVGPCGLPRAPLHAAGGPW